MVLNPAVQLAFIDVEASGLSEHSYPVEIGWAILGGSSGSRLVRPAVEWDLDGWDANAERVHGITLGRLASTGRHADDVAAVLNKDLAVKTLALTDGFDWDSFWIARLFDASRHVCSFELADFWWSVSRVVDRQRVADARTRDLQLPRLHRAKGDAERLRSIWLWATSL